MMESGTGRIARPVRSSRVVVGAFLVLVGAGCTSPDDSRSPRREVSMGEVTHPASLVRGVDSAPAADAPAPAPSNAAADTNGLHLVVWLSRRALYVLDGSDTLRRARVGVGMDSTLSYEDRVWSFRTPRGARRVIAKEADPKWSPPEWHYVEMARARGLKLVRLPANAPYVLPDSSRIEVRNGDVGLVRDGEEFRPFAEGEEVIWDGTLYIPPLGTRQRRIAGELGRYRLDLGDGYLLHGTPYTESIGQPSSHGCIRLADADIAWLYRHVPVGTAVTIR